MGKNKNFVAKKLKKVLISPTYPRGGYSVGGGLILRHLPLKSQECEFGYQLTSIVIMSIRI